MTQLRSLALIAISLFISHASPLGQHEINPNVLSSSFSELDELSPEENNCTRHSNNIVCSKIPLFCRNVCDSNGRLDFDSSLRRISPFSFGSYQIRQSMDVNFKQGGLARIEADAFNGLVIDADTQLVINIEYPIAYDDDDEKEQEEQNIDYSSDESDNGELSQIEYDVAVSSTRPTKKRAIDSLVIDSNAFRGITVKEGARFVVNIKNARQVEFAPKSLSGGDENKLLSSSSLLVTVENADLVMFRSECAKSWRANTPDYDYDADYNRNG